MLESEGLLREGLGREEEGKTGQDDDDNNGNSNSNIK